MIEPGALLAYARELSADEREVAQRTAVSRAYYAAFLQLRQSALDASSLPGQRTAADHYRLQRLLKDVAHLRTQHVCRWLRELRNQADYDLAEAFGLRSSRTALALAQTLIAR
ncbi:MAG: hypothetical protein U5Q44_10615 [Dehalococcoidia bacterium]|nr:hypothetical protein [Dehalococcoidia bacterium]